MKKTLEEVFNGNAKETMSYWNIEEFKRTHPSLFKAIIKSMEECQTGGVTRANYFGGDNELYKEHHREESERLQRVLISKGFLSCGLGDAEGIWMHYSDEMWAAGFIGMPEDDEDLYNSIKDYLTIVRSTPLG